MGYINKSRIQQTVRVSWSHGAIKQIILGDQIWQLSYSSSFSQIQIEARNGLFAAAGL